MALEIYLNNLRSVYDQDESELRRKEATYQGSWKKRGGVGAFMMLARKWDRLEIMSAERGYDIFKDVGNGNDGTMLAEIRDLRRYLALVEAELIWRSAQGLLDRAAELREISPPPEPLRPWRSTSSTVVGPKPSPEDGSQHESLSPWVVGGWAAALTPHWYEKVGDNTFVLRQFVEMDGANTMPSSLRHVYADEHRPSLVSRWRLKVSECPMGALPYFPGLGLNE